MAIQIPVYQRQAKQEPALPGYRQAINDPTPEALSNLGEGISRAGEGVSRLVKVVRDQQNSAAAMGAYSELSDAKQSYLDDPDNGFTSRKGEFAMAERDVYAKRFEDTAQKIRDKLSNDEQRHAFDGMYARERRSFAESADRHVAQQADALYAQKHASALEAATGDAVGAASRGDYGQIGSAVQVINAAVADMAHHNGWDAATTKAQQRVATTQAHLGVLDTMVENGRTSDAKEYITNIKPELDGAMLAKSNIEKRIESSNVRDESRALADQVWNEANGDPNDAAKLLREKNIKDSVLFDTTEQRLRQRGSEESTARKQADSPRIGRLEQIIYQHGNFSQAADDYQLLSDEGKADILRIRNAELRSRREAGTKERQLQAQLDREAEADFRSRDLIGNNGNDQSSIDIGNTYTDASKRQRDLLIERQKKVQREREKDQGVPLTAFDAQAKDRAAKAGLNKDKTKAFLNYMHDSYFAWAQDPKNEGKKAPPPDVAKKMIGDALLFGERAPEAGFFQPNMFQFEAQQKGDPFVPFPQQPGGGAPPPATPAAPTTSPGNVVIVGPGGAQKQAPSGPALDAWLAAHPEWKRR